MNQQKDNPDKFLKRPLSDSDYAAHSRHIRQILADSGIQLPYSLNIGATVQFLEKEIQRRTYIKTKYGDFFTITISSGGQRLLETFQTIPPTYYALVRKNLSSINEKSDEYITSCAKKRTDEAVKPLFCTSNNREKKKEMKEDSTISSESKEVTKSDEEETVKEQNKESVEEIGESTAAYTKSKLKRMKKKQKINEERRKQKEYESSMKDRYAADSAMLDLERNGVPKKVLSDSERSAHSSRIRQLLADFDIQLPRNVKLDEIVQTVEDTIQYWKVHLGIKTLADSTTLETEPQDLQDLFEMVLSPAQLETFLDNLLVIKKKLEDYMISVAEERIESEKELTEPVPTNSMLDQTNKKKNKKSSDQVAVNTSTFSIRSVLISSLAVKGVVGVAEVQSQIQKYISNGKKLMAIGKLHEGADLLATAVHISEQSEQLSSSLEQSLPPAHFALVRKNMTRMEHQYNRFYKQVMEDLSKPPDNKIVKPVESANDQKKKKKKVDKPEHISEEHWLRFYDLGRHVSDFVLDAFEMYESGDFPSWDKNRVKNIESSLGKKNEAKMRYWRNIVCEYVLVERMKEMDFFCCDLCQMALFNYKHALIHFTSDDHCKKETDAVRNSGVDSVRHVLGLFTDLPKKLSENDVNAENARMKKNGRPDYKLFTDMRNQIPTPFRPDFMHRTSMTYSLTNQQGDDLSLFNSDPETGRVMFGRMEAKAVIERVKCDDVRRNLANFTLHLEEGPTVCLECQMKTGDRDGYFAHLMSYRHLKLIYEKEGRDMGFNRTVKADLTLANIVNILKKDLVV